MICLICPSWNEGGAPLTIAENAVELRQGGNMKAVRFHTFGGPLVYEEAPKPVAQEGEVVVRVMACALNHLDLWVRKGVPAYPVTLPHIPGSDVAGLVEEVGPGVEDVALGSPVLIAPGLSCFLCAFCLSGHDNLCKSYQIFGAGDDGGYAEFTKAPAVNIISIPEGISFEEAAAFPLTFLTAWHMLVTRARLRAGQDLLVVAGGSGVGSAAIQIGKLLGARVFATSGTPEKMALTKKIGADIVVNHTQQDFSKEIREITSGRGMDVVIEHVGPATFSASLHALAKNGVLVTCGASSGMLADLDLRYLFLNELSVLGARMGTRAELMEVMRLVSRRKLLPVIDSVYPLAQAEVASERMRLKNLFGKLLLKPDWE